MRALMKNKYFKLLVLFLLSSSSIMFAAPVTGTVGVAEIKGTEKGSKISGKVILTDTAEGLKISLSLENVPPGKHGFHIHEHGACGELGKAAGGHYNPDGVPHGLLVKDGFKNAHAGDLGNIEILQNGTGKFEVVIQGLTLTGGKYNVAGRSFILHEKEDDFSQPVGNAGNRIGCGIIEFKK